MIWFGIKNINSITLVILILLVNISSFSQVDSKVIKNNNQIFIGESLYEIDLRSKDLVGSVYISKEFLPARLNEDNVIYSVNYNAFQDQMVIKKEGNSVFLRKDYDFMVTFLNVDKTYRVFDYHENGQKKTGFFVVLFQGEKISLLLKEIIKFYEEKEAKSGYDKYQPPKLKREKDKFFLGYKNNSTKELPKKKKDILKLFTSKARDIESFAKRNNLGFKKKEDLTKIFNYYNSLN